MHQRREHEDDARFVERARHHLDRRIDRHAERLEDVGAAALRRERAIAVLRDAHARAGHEQRRGRRDVEGVDRPAAGAAGVDELGAALRRQRDHRAAERAHDRRELGRRLALDAKADEQRRDLRRRRVAAEHDVERRGQFARLGCFARRKAFDRAEERVGVD